MKIIQIIDVRWYNACADFAVKQALGLSLLGHDILLLANPGSPPAQKAREAGLDVFDKIDFSEWRAVAVAPSRLRSVARELKADIVFAHRGESHLIAALASGDRKFAVARFRGDVRAPRSDIFSRRLIEKMTDGIAVSSNRLAEDYKSKFELDGIPVRVIHPGIDLERFKIAAGKEILRTKFGLDPQKFTVGIVGRLSPVKGHKYFLEAAALAARKSENIQFVVAGEGAQIKMDDLKKDAQNLGIKNIAFFGLINNIAELMASFDIGVVSSTGSEMICRVLLEYFAAGLPVIATDINQISELMGESSGGILVPPEDSAKMADAMIEMAGNTTIRSISAVNGRHWVDNHSLIALGKDTEQFLSEVINARR